MFTGPYGNSAPVLVANGRLVLSGKRMVQQRCDTPVESLPFRTVTLTVVALYSRCQSSPRSHGDNGRATSSS